MTSLLILGAGGHARVVAETAVACGGFSYIAFLDDKAQAGDFLMGMPLLGPLNFSLEPSVFHEFLLPS